MRNPITRAWRRHGRSRYGRAATRGFAIAPVFVAIALLSVLTFSASLSTRGVGIHNLRMTVDLEISTQANLIRQRLIQCSLRYPTPGFPVTPGSGLVRDLQCPGAPSGYQAMWNSENNPTLPKAPANHAEWTYINDASGIRIAAAALAGYITNSELITGQSTAWRRFHATEADCSQSGSAASITVWIQKTGSAPAPTAC